MKDTATTCGAPSVVPQIVWRDFQRTAFTAEPAGGAIELWLSPEPGGWRLDVNVRGYGADGWRGRVWPLEATDEHAAKAETQRRLPDLLRELGLCPCGHDWSAHHERWAASGTEWSPGPCQVQPCECAAWQGREPEEER